jgi:hypothetical protein
MHESCDSHCIFSEKIIQICWWHQKRYSLQKQLSHITLYNYKNSVLNSWTEMCNKHYCLLGIYTRILSTDTLNFAPLENWSESLSKILFLTISTVLEFIDMPWGNMKWFLYLGCPITWCQPSWTPTAGASLLCYNCKISLWIQVGIIFILPAYQWYRKVSLQTQVRIVLIYKTMVRVRALPSVSFSPFSVNCQYSYSQLSC